MYKKIFLFKFANILATSSNSLLTDKHMELNDFLKLYLDLLESSICQNGGN